MYTLGFQFGVYIHKYDEMLVICQFLDCYLTTVSKYKILCKDTRTEISLLRSMTYPVPAWSLIPNYEYLISILHVMQNKALSILGGLGQITRTNKLNSDNEITFLKSCIKVLAQNVQYSACKRRDSCICELENTAKTHK